MHTAKSSRSKWVAVAAWTIGIGAGAPTWAQPPARPDEVKAFVAQVDGELQALGTRAATAEWIKSTYITPDTLRNAAWANEAVMGYLSRKIQASTRFRGVPLDGDTARKLTLLRLSSSPLPAPADPKTREELATTASELEGIYGRGKWCGADGKKPCRDLQALENVLAQSRRYDELLDAWSGWHTVSRPMRPLYERLVALGNQGAKEIGYGNLGELWRAGYDMTPAEFERDTDRLWNEVRPFYEELHCYARTRLARVYGADKVSATGPIPAHLLGNMWAQEWREIYPLLEPFKGQASLDVSAELKRRKYDAVKMVKLGEAFFTSLGFDPLPASFWERSLLNKPRDRDVVCHASAWNLNSRDDLRIKMCVQPKEDDLLTIHHELGHVFYYQSYAALPVLYQSGANDGFHEAVGDAIQLSVNAEYLKRVGLLSQTSAGEKAILNAQMKDALERVAFLPFGKLVDQWRWDVFSGKVRSSDYNAAWWELRRKYQGVAPPLARTAADFDPGAKYHVPANVPYTRYFLARFLQFQFHKGMCQAAGHKGPLHACSIYGNAEAGKKLKAMLALGASKPWPDALEVLTGDREIRAEPLMEYYAPLREWLRTQNAGQKCGW